MAQCVPYRLDRIVSPHQANGIGQIVLKGAKGPAPTRVLDVKVTHGNDGFTAELVLDHGKAVRASLEFKSLPDGTWVIREKLVASSNITTTRIATGLIGILNNPGWVYERGRRTIKIDSREQAVPALSGRSLAADNARVIEIDGAMRIAGTRPLRLGYLGARKPERSRATDERYLNYHPDERTWRAGQTISEYEATVQCMVP
jgi:hypothetical protein